MFENYPAILKVKDVCDMLDIERHTAYKLIINNDIDSFKLGKGENRIVKDSLISYVLRSSELDSNSSIYNYKTLDSYPDIMNADEACEYLNISRPTCLKLLREGSLKGFKIDKGREWKIPKLSLDLYIHDSVNKKYISPLIIYEGGN